MISVMWKNAVKLSRNDLSTEVPVRTNVSERWKGVAHRELADGILASLESQGIGVTSEVWYVDRGGNLMVGGLGLSLPKRAGLAKLKGMEYAMGILHSNDGRKAIRIAAGARVMICSNGVLTGSFLVQKKHTKHLELQANLDNGVERLVGELGATQTFIDDLKNLKLGPARVDEIAMEVGRQHLLPWSAVGKVDAEYRNPSFDEFKEFNGTGWGWYNAYNYVLQQVSPDRQLRSLDEVRPIIFPQK